MDRRHFLSAGVAFAVIGASAALAAGTTPTPVDFVKQIYAFSAGADGKWDGPTAYTGAKARKRFLTKAFQAAIDAEEKLSQGEVGAVDFDPISSSQDPAVLNLTVTLVTGTADKATVKARFTRTRDPKDQAYEVFYELLREGGSWRVDDIKAIREPNQVEPTSIRKLLANPG